MSLLDETPIEMTDPLTIESISQLGSRMGDPADTLANVVRLIQKQFQTDVCSVYLIKPDRANLVLAATVGLRPESVGRVSMRLNEGLTGLVAEQLRPIVVDDATRHPRFKYFPEAGEEPYHSFLGVPLFDQGVIQGVLVVQTREPRSFSREETPMLVVAANQLAPIVSEARTLEQFIAPAYERIWALARNLWWSWDPEAESCSASSTRCAGASWTTTRSRCLSEISMEQLEERSRRLVLHSRINYAYRRLQEYLQSDDTWGATHAGVLRARPVAYFSAEFGLHESVPIYSGGLGRPGRRPHQERQRPGRPAGRRRAVLRPGLFPAAPRRRRLAAAKSTSTSTSKSCRWSWPWAGPAARSPSRIETRTGQLCAAVWKMTVGRNTLLSARFATSRATRPRTAS